MSEFWSGKRVLVTGIAGFVGANLARAAHDAGATVGGIDRAPSSPSMRALGVDAKAIVADVTDLRAMVNAMAETRPDVVYHLAGMGHIADCQAAPFPAFDVNAMGTVVVLEAVRRAAPEATVVCASSNHVYLGGLSGSESRYNEFDDLDAIDAYGSAKIAADLAVRCYGQSYDLRAAAVRHVNSYGPADPHVSHLVTGAILSCLEGKRPVLRSDGSAIKGYLHVADVVGAYLAVAERIDDLPGHAVNVAAPACEASALEVAREVMWAAGMDGEPEVLNQNLSQRDYVERLDDSLIRTFGWAPRFGLRTGILDVYEWYRAHGGGAWLND